MMRNHFACFGLLAGLLFLSTTAFSQTPNFDQTWKEFLENDKISNMSALTKPDERYDRADYAKYLLMNTNTCFCQSRVEEAEDLMAQVQTIDGTLLGSIPGYVGKMEGLETKLLAYHSIDAIWQDFLRTREVSLRELDAVPGAGSVCEKRTLAKYSYMKAYAQFCQGDVPQARNIFETRTLRLVDQTSLRIEDVEGLPEEVARMRALFEDLSALDQAWSTYVRTGVSPGFNQELPLFPCYPIPKMKELMLKGVLDLCLTGPGTLDQIKQLQSQSGVTLDPELAGKVRELEAALAESQANLAALNEAWTAFIPENKVPPTARYGYEYCEKEPLIRAWIMDGFAYTCELGEEMLRKIDSMQRANMTPLEQITMIKINELAELSDQYQADGREIEGVWNLFVSQRDTLFRDYQSAEFYCDNIHQVKDWTIRGLMSSCEESTLYLDQIEAFNRTFEFNFAPDLECRVQKLRIKVWECRHQALLKLARIEAPEAVEERLAELMTEYRMGPRPEECTWEN